MKRPVESNLRLVERLAARGTLFERLIMASDEWMNVDEPVDSPALMRDASDVRQALLVEGWQPHLRAHERNQRGRA